MTNKETIPPKVTAPSLAGRAGGESVGSIVCTIGFFDGVHRGHECLIRQVLDEARGRGARSLLVTFDRHPRTVFAPASTPALLTTAPEKMALLRATGVDSIFVLPFDRAMAALTAREFMQQVLHDQLGVTALVVGYDHHFGRPQGETFDDYVAIGREVGIDVVPARELEGEHVSSSAIRRALEAGDVGAAARLLGRPYTWTGRVVHGRGIGHRLGFPTANLEAVAPEKMLPARGAYAIKVKSERVKSEKSEVESEGVKSALGPQERFFEQSETEERVKSEKSAVESEAWAAGMLNIGRRPTLDNGDDVSVEAHLFDTDHDLYGQTLTLAFVERLRPEQRFDSEVALARQLRLDEQAARRCTYSSR